MKIVKKAFALILLFIGGLALNYLLVMGVFWQLHYEIHDASYPAAVLIAMAAALVFDSLRRLFRKKLDIEAPIFLLFAYAPSIILCQLLQFEIERISDRENFLSLLIGACVLAACGLVWLGVSALGERAKVARAVYLILVGGFAGNLAAWFVTGLVSLVTFNELLGIIAGAVLVVGATALLNLLRSKCKKLPGAAVILCAQLPWVVWSIVNLAAASNYRKNMHGSTLAKFWAGMDVVFFTQALIMGLLIAAGAVILLKRSASTKITAPREQ